jgi:hypothetical protein
MTCTSMFKGDINFELKFLVLVEKPWLLSRYWTRWVLPEFYRWWPELDGSLVHQVSAWALITVVPNTRARVVFADGSAKVLRKFGGQNLLTKSDHKKGQQTPKYVPRLRKGNNNANTSPHTTHQLPHPLCRHGIWVLACPYTKYTDQQVWSCEKGSGGGGRGDSGRGEGRRWCVLGGIGRERSVCTVCTIECTGRQYRTNLLYCSVFGYE